MEIGLIPIEPDYHNPFKVKQPPKRSNKKSKNQKNKRERKPQLSNHIELWSNRDENFSKNKHYIVTWKEDTENVNST